MDKILKGSLAFCIISFSIIGLVYALIVLIGILGAIIKPSDMPYCDEVTFSTPRPVGYGRYCKGREKKKEPDYQEDIYYLKSKYCSLVNYNDEYCKDFKQEQEERELIDKIIDGVKNEKN